MGILEEASGSAPAMGSDRGLGERVGWVEDASRRESGQMEWRGELVTASYGRG